MFPCAAVEAQIPLRFRVSYQEDCTPVRLLQVSYHEWFMPRRLGLSLTLLAMLCSCKPSEESHARAIIGAVLIDGSGGPPRSDSVVVVTGERIGAAGPRSTVPISSEAGKIDGSGKFLLPALVDACESASPAGLLRASTAEQ